MIHLALSIFAFMFLASIAVGVIGFLIIYWWQVLAVVGVIVLVLVMANQSGDRSASPSYAVQSSGSVPQVPLPERLHYDPSLVASLADGEAWIIAAYASGPHQLRLVVRFDDAEQGASMLRGDAKRAAVALKDYLCGAKGLLTTYELRPQDVVIVAYEGDVRVGEVALPESYCSAGGERHSASMPGKVTQ